MTTIIRPIELSDVATISIIEHEDPYSPWSETLIKDCINREHYYNAALVNGQQLLGYVIWYIPFDECHLMTIAVAPKQRGQGYGRQLLTHAIEQSRAKANYMILEVRQENHIARQLYESFGFVEIGVRRDYYPKGSGNRDALVYRLELLP